MFPGRLISLRGDVEWPARSPDLSPCGFFLWGYLKEKVFKHRPRSLEDLKERIQQEIDTILPELTRRVMKNFRERLQQCVANNGRHMSDLIFKTDFKKTVFNLLFRNIFNFFLDSFFHFFIPLQNVGDLYVLWIILIITRDFQYFTILQSNF